MNVLHCLDNSNLGGIQELVLLLYKHSRHKHDFWAADGSMAPIMRAEGMVLWGSGLPPEVEYDIAVGNTVGGWSYADTFGWIKQRGWKTVECMHSNARSPTPPELVDRFVGLNQIATSLNGQMADRRTIYGMVETDRFYPRIGQKIGRLSRLVQEKRPLDFLDLARQFPDQQFVCGGDGALYNTMFSSAPPNLALPGLIRDFPAFYASLKMFVFPTQDECCCISVAMAQAAKVPVICQDMPPLRETTGGHALYASNTGEYIAHIRHLLDHPTDGWEMAEHGVEWVRSHFSPSVVAGAWDAMLEELIL